MAASDSTPKHWIFQGRPAKRENPTSDKERIEVAFELVGPWAVTPDSAFTGRSLS